MSFLARLSPARLSKPKTTLHTALSKVFHLKTAAVLGACLYQYLSVLRMGANQDARQELSKRRRTRCVREFVGDRVEEWWGVVGREKDGSCEFFFNFLSSSEMILLSLPSCLRE